MISCLFPSNDSPVNGIIHFGDVPFHIMNILRGGNCGSVNVSRSSLILTPCAAIVGQVLTRACLNKVMYSTVARRTSRPTRSRVSRVLHHGRGLGSTARAARTSRSSFGVHSRRRVSDVVGSAVSAVAVLLNDMTKVSLLMNNVKVVGVVCISIARQAHRVNLQVDIKTEKVSVLGRFLVRTVLLSMANKVVKIVLKIDLSLDLGTFLRVTARVRP